MLQLYPVYLLWNRCKTLKGSPDHMHANSTNKPCTLSFPDCDIWAVAPPSRRDGYLTMLGFLTSQGPMCQMENTNMTRFLEEAVHTVVCTQYKHKYRKLLEQIDAIKCNITYKIEKVMPCLLPIERALLYRKETMTENNKEGNSIGIDIFQCKHFRWSNYERYQYKE